jgi:diacylglycerol kinase (ATP)
LVLTAEGLNTALEFLTDLVSPEYQPLAEKAKDVAAGAVLVASLAAGVIGAIIFLPKLAALAGW